MRIADLTVNGRGIHIEVSSVIIAVMVVYIVGIAVEFLGSSRTRGSGIAAKGRNRIVLWTTYSLLIGFLIN